jgi:hypothetical protein
MVNGGDAAVGAGTRKAAKGVSWDAVSVRMACRCVRISTEAYITKMQAFTTQRPARTLQQRGNKTHDCCRHQHVRHVCASSWQHKDGVEVSRRDLIGLAMLAATLEQAAPAHSVSCRDSRSL